MRKCKPSKAVSNAGRSLAKSNSKAVKSKAGSTLAKHKGAKH